MDDLKLFVPNENKLADQLKLVKQYSEDIRMEFGLDKYAKCTFVHRKTKIIQITAQSMKVQKYRNEETKHLTNTSE